MNITDIRIRLKPENASGTLATAAVTIDSDWAVHDIRILHREGRFYLAMPSRRCADGLTRDLVHPVHGRAREELTRAVLAAYRRELFRSRMSVS